MSVFRLDTPRLTLRDYHPDDWERVHIYGSVPEFSQYEPWGPNTVDDSKNYVNLMHKQSLEKDRYKFEVAVCLKESGLLIGGCAVRRESQESVVGNLGWAINPDFQKQGFCFEAAQAIIKFGFEKLGLYVIYATCDVRNAPSARVMEKLGMRRVGHIIGDKIVKDRLRDTYRYEINKR